jgi:hypothetical protein
MPADKETVVEVTRQSLLSGNDVTHAICKGQGGRLTLETTFKSSDPAAVSWGESVDLNAVVGLFVQAMIR